MATRSTPKAKQAPPHVPFGAKILRHGRAQIRFLIALCVGLAVGLFAPIEEVIPRILAGWNAGGWLYLILVGIKMWRAEIEGIKREAGIERESRIVVLVVVTLGSLFTLLALFAQLMALKSEHGIDRTISIGFSVSTIFLSWMLIHTVFALFYAHEFHSEGKDHAGGHGGGLDFPRRQHPRLSRFPLFLLRGRHHGANLRRRGDIERDARRGDAARHLVVLLQHRSDRSSGQHRRPAGAGLAHVPEKRERVF